MKNDDHYTLGEVTQGLLSVFWLAFVILTLALIIGQVIQWAWS